jgi:hypothetical protein
MVVTEAAPLPPATTALADRTRAAAAAAALTVRICFDQVIYFPLERWLRSLD